MKITIESPDRLESETVKELIKTIIKSDEDDVEIVIKDKHPFSSPTKINVVTHPQLRC